MVMSALMSALLEGSRERTERGIRCQGVEKRKMWSSDLKICRFGGVGGFGDLEN